LSQAESARRAKADEAKVTVKGFYVATLLFAANVATFLKIDREVFLAHAAHAFERISRENSRRKSRTVDPGAG